MAGWGAASVPLKVALIVLCVALVVFVIGFSTEKWASTTYASEIRAKSQRIPVFVDQSLGLWRYTVCYNARNNYLPRDTRRYIQYYGCNSNDIDLFIDGLRYCGDWYHGVQAVECMGLILMVGAVILLFLYFFVQSVNQKKYLYIIIALTFGAVVFIVIGVGIYGSKIHNTKYIFYNYKLNWSFGLTVAGALLGFIAGIAEIIELRK
ncbi:uncharacterized protein LOC125650774 [Ostrea edulis]|uniref:uncharacterized protein LOC125650774 n=1 Tax=Ostrea edulis TaxID=37623 RepID=UPI0020956BD5|nr:uncharacterized protein LOC125650774 [Ostrea edulis]